MTEHQQPSISKHKAGTHHSRIIIHNKSWMYSIIFAAPSPGQLLTSAQ
jgi:hypothetical protein